MPKTGKKCQAKLLDTRKCIKKVDKVTFLSTLIFLKEGSYYLPFLFELVLYFRSFFLRDADTIIQLGS